MPTCFISYAWEEDESKQFVRKFADDLRERNLEVILDQDNNSLLGSNIDVFMDSIYYADFVFVMCTPTYKQKINDPNSKVSSEWEKIIKRLEVDREEKKISIIPVLLKGSEKESFPPQLRNKTYVDLLNKDYQEELGKIRLEINKLNTEHTQNIGECETKDSIARCWQENTIIDSLKINQRVYRIFLNILKCTNDITQKYLWKTKAPLFSKDYETTLGAYLYFFKRHKFPESLLQIPESEIEALIAGTAVEILSRLSGINVQPTEFINNIKNLFEKESIEYRPNSSFWDIVTQMVSNNGTDERKEMMFDEVSLALNNKGRMHISIKDIPFQLFAELINVLNVCSLFISTCYENSTEDKLMQAKLKLQKSISYSKVEGNKLVFLINSFSTSEFRELYDIYFKALPQASFDASGKIRSKWVDIRVKEMVGESVVSEIPNHNLSANLENLVAQSNKDYLRLRSAFEVDCEGYIEIPLYKEIGVFIESSKVAMFATGPSGVGKTKTIQSFVRNNLSTNTLVVPFSPKSKTFQNKKGLDMFLDIVANINESNLQDDILTNINSLLESKSQYLVFVLDGLNEIDAELFEQNSHYTSILDLAEKIYKLKLSFIKIIVTCRDNALLQYMKFTLKYPDPEVFYYGTTDSGRNAVPYYYIDELDYNKQIDFVDMYFKNPNQKQRFISYLSSSKHAQTQFSHPYLIAIAGHIYNTSSYECSNYSTAEIFNQFTESMLMRIGNNQEMHVAYKIINRYCKLMLSKDYVNRRITQFEIIDSFDRTEKSYAMHVLSLLQGINILSRGLSNAPEYIRFTHDRMEEYLIGKFLFSEENRTIIDKALKFATVDQIFFFGVQNYFNKCVKNKSYDNIIMNIDHWNTICPAYLPLLTIESFKGVEFNDWLAIMEDAKKFMLNTNTFVWLIINGLEALGNSGIYFVPELLIENINKLSKTYSLFNDSLPYLLYIAAKISFTKNSDYNSCRKFCDMAYESINTTNNSFYRSLVDLQYAIMLRKEGKTNEALTRLKEIHNQFKHIQQWERDCETILEIGGALRENKQFVEALSFYAQVDIKNIQGNNILIGRLFTQMGTVFKNIMQDLLETPELNLIEIKKYYAKAMDSFDEAIKYTEKGSNILFEITARAEQAEALYKISQIEPDKKELFYYCHDLVEKKLSNFPVPDRLVPHLRGNAYIAEQKGDIISAINHVQNGKKCAISYNLGYRVFECDYHLGHLIERHKEMLEPEYIDLGIEALKDALNYQEPTKYKENCEETLRQLEKYKA